MSQATLPGRYRNSNLFSGYYLDERVFGLDEWDCDEAAEQAFEELQALYEAERGTLESYDEDPLRRHWIDEVLSILGYESLPETPILDARGSIDRALYDSADDRRAAAAMKDDERGGGRVRWNVRSIAVGARSQAVGRRFHHALRRAALLS